MISFLNDFWAAFRAAFHAARQMRRRRFTVIDGHRNRAIRQAALLTGMSADELQAWSRQWGGSACRRELHRRGLG